MKGRKQRVKPAKARSFASPNWKEVLCIFSLASRKLELWFHHDGRQTLVPDNTFLFHRHKETICSDQKGHVTESAPTLHETQTLLGVAHKGKVVIKNCPPPPSLGAAKVESFSSIYQPDLHAVLLMGGIAFLARDFACRSVVVFSFAAKLELIFLLFLCTSMISHGHFYNWTTARKLEEKR